jgi:hypothetical protein
VHVSFHEYAAEYRVKKALVVAYQQERAGMRDVFSAMSA